VATGGPTRITWPRRAVAILAAVACLCGVASASSSTSTRSRVALFGHLGFVSPSGIAGVFAGCFGSEPCIGSLTIKRGRVTIGHRMRETIGANNGGIVHVKLSPSARRSLAFGRISVTVRMADAGGAKTSTQVELVPFGTAAAIASAERAVVATAPPRIKVFGHTGFVNTGSTTGIFLGCFGTTVCHGAMTLTAGGAVVGGHDSFYISPNDGSIVHVALRANGRRILAQRHRLTVTVTVNDSAGPGATATVTLVPYYGDINDYALVTSPATATGSSPTRFDLALTNASSPGLNLGSAKFRAPPGFKVLKAWLPRGARGRVTVAGSVVALRRLGLESSATLHVRVTATAPARCKVYSSTWGSAAWEGENFNVRGLIRDNARSISKTTVKGPCALRFVTEPATAIAAQHITGAAGDPSGTPVAVEIVDGKGKVVRSSRASVTIGIRDNPTGATLRGTRTVRAVHGVARFVDLSLSTPGNGYRLRASSPRLPSASSRPFDVGSTVATCAQNQICQTKLSTTASSFAITARADPGAPNAGTLSESVDVGTPLECSGYTQEDSHWWDFSMSSANRSKIITYTIKVPLIPLSGTLEAILNETQACFGALAEFTTKSGLPAPARVLPDGSSGFIGLLPDCPVPTGPCVVSRQSTLDLSSPIGFDIVLTLYVPEGLAGDPWMRT
jgi:hypothetical protein